MSGIVAVVRPLLSDERGGAAVEYSIIVGLISAAAIGIIIAVAAWATGRWQVLQVGVGA